MLKNATEFAGVLQEVHGRLAGQIEKKLLDKYASVPTVSLDCVYECYDKLKISFTTSSTKIEKFCELAQNELDNLSISSIDEKIIARKFYNNNKLMSLIITINSNIKSKSEPLTCYK